MCVPWSCAEAAILVASGGTSAPGATILRSQQDEDICYKSSAAPAMRVPALVFRHADWDSAVRVRRHTAPLPSAPSVLGKLARAA